MTPFEIHQALSRRQLLNLGARGLGALGAASLAGLAVGTWNSRDELRSLWREAIRFHPTYQDEDMRRQSDLWREGVKRAQQWASSNET